MEDERQQQMKDDLTKNGRHPTKNNGKQPKIINIKKWKTPHKMNKKLRQPKNKKICFHFL
jgi:hypothetical protein